MGEVRTEDLTHAGESQHGGKATLMQSVPVKETFGGEIVWQGVVHVFSLAGNLSNGRAACCQP